MMRCWGQPLIFAFLTCLEQKPILFKKKKSQQVRIADTCTYTHTLVAGYVTSRGTRPRTWEQSREQLHGPRFQHGSSPATPGPTGCQCSADTHSATSLPLDRGCAIKYSLCLAKPPLNLPSLYLLLRCPSNGIANVK